jgi:pyrroloquinoline-quinone synthase
MLVRTSQRSLCVLIYFIQTDPDPTQPLDAAEFERQLRANAHAYHDYHAFTVLLNSGRASPAQLRGWLANRFYYQIHIPRKEAAIDPWLRLGEALGLSANELWSTEHVLPGVRTAVNAYVDLTQQQPWQEAVCASLTELFAAQIHGAQLANWASLYPWIERSGLEYFRAKMALTPQDIQEGLRVTLEYFRTREAQSRALGLLKLKLDLLWCVLDAIEDGLCTAPPSRRPP